MTYTLSFTLPFLPRMTNASRVHWRVIQKETNEIKRAVALLIGPRRPASPLKRASVTIVRHSAREPDYDGLVSGGKRALDALVACGVLADDKPSVIGVPKYEWKKAPPNQGRVEVCVRGEME